MRKQNNNIKDPEPLNFARYFDRFAASLVCCLSEARQGKLADKRPVKMTCINFLSGSFIILFFSYTLPTTTIQTTNYNLHLPISRLHLQFHHMSINPITSFQFIRRSVFSNNPVFQHNNLISAIHSSHSMCNN